MAKSIDRKNKKMQRKVDELREEGFGTQEEAKKDIEEMETKVETGARSSRLKKLSDAKKKEALAEYEKIIEKLKELELRNKKKQSFKHKFKGLQYFPTLNGRSVYSENMQSQAKADKDSISAMMAYSQLETGFNVTFEMMSARIRPERREEFLTLCKSKPELAHKLTGMTKLIQFYNQRDFTRAYAAMVFFGLENDMELMETFLKVKFDGVFKMQINDFKAKIAHASAFDEKEIRANAGMNVFSQTDSIATSMESSYRNKDVIDTFIATANIKDPKEKEKARNEVYSTIYTQAYQAANGNLKVVRELVYKTVQEANDAELNEVINNIRKKYELIKLKYINMPGNTIVFNGKKRSKKEVLTTLDAMCADEIERTINKLKDMQRYYSYNITPVDTVESRKGKFSSRGEADWEIASRKISFIDEELLQLKSRLETETNPEKRTEIEASIQDCVRRRLDCVITIECSDAAFNEYKQKYANSESALITKRTEKANLLANLSIVSGYDREIQTLREHIAELDSMIVVARENNAVDPTLKQIITLTEKKNKNLDFIIGIGKPEFNNADMVYGVVAETLSEEKVNNAGTTIVEEKDNIAIQDAKPAEDIFEIYRALIVKNGLENYDISVFECNQELDGYISQLNASLAELETSILAIGDRNSPEKARLETQKADMLGRIKKLQDLKEFVGNKENFIPISHKLNSPHRDELEQKIIGLKYALTTKIDGKTEKVYLDELSPEKLTEIFSGKSKSKDEIIHSAVNRALNHIEGFLQIENLPREHISIFSDGLTRTIKLLESLKDKIPEEDFTALRDRCNKLEAQFESLELTESSEEKVGDMPIVEESSETSFEEPVPVVATLQKVKLNTSKKDNIQQQFGLKSNTQQQLGSDAIFDEFLNGVKDNCKGSDGSITLKPEEIEAMKNPPQ